jgi:hypothetical protein
MAGPVGHDYYTLKNLKRNWRFLLGSSVIVGVCLYFWAR